MQPNTENQTATQAMATLELNRRVDRLLDTLKRNRSIIDTMKLFNIATIDFCSTFLEEPETIDAAGFTEESKQDILNNVLSIFLTLSSEILHGKYQREGAMVDIDQFMQRLHEEIPSEELISFNLIRMFQQQLEAQHPWMK